MEEKLIGLLEQIAGELRTLNETLKSPASVDEDKTMVFASFTGTSKAKTRAGSCRWTRWWSYGERA